MDEHHRWRQHDHRALDGKYHIDNKQTIATHKFPMTIIVIAVIHEWIIKEFVLKILIKIIRIYMEEKKTKPGEKFVLFNIKT